MNPISPSHYSFHLNNEFNSIPCLHVLAPYFGRGSTNWVLVWYNILAEETQDYICAANFKPVLHLMLERSANTVLAQTLAKRWWDTTHTFHIADREMTITPHNFHCMTGLRFNGVLTRLEDNSST